MEQLSYNASWHIFLQVIGVVSAVLKSADPPANLEQFALSKATGVRERRNARQSAGEQIKASFVPPERVVVHWDGKTLQVKRGYM